MIALWTAVFLVSTAVVFYVHLGYPAVLAFLASRARRDRRQRLPVLGARVTPFVSIICAAWNEEDVIGAKIDNALAQDYPSDRFEVLIVSDGSDDRTHEIVSSRLPRRDRANAPVRLVALPQRGGKARALRHATAVAKGEIFVLTDANAFFAKDAVARLVARLEDATVSAAFGKVEIRPDGCPFAEGEGLFYRLENKIHEDESLVDSAVGVDGALYAIRRESFVAPPDGAVLDDLEVAIEATRGGGRVVFEPSALGWEDATPTLRQEFRRKSRIVAGAMQALRGGRLLPDPGRGLLWFEYVSHKLLRWLTPLFLIAALVASIALAFESPVGVVLALAQPAFYTTAVAGLVVQSEVPLGVYGVPLYFTAMHAAALVGLLRGLRGKQAAKWKKADRKAVPAMQS